MKWYNKTDFPVVARTSPGMCRRPRAQALQFGPIRDYNAAGTVRMGQMNGSLFVRRTSPRRRSYMTTHGRLRAGQRGRRAPNF
jgi:hypothetical protein